MLDGTNTTPRIAAVIGRVVPGPEITNKHDGRVLWIDAAKGIGIILVVIGHTLRGLQSGNLVSFKGYFGQIDNAIYSFHMPLMFLLSGFFVHKALDQNWYGYISKNAQRLVWPLILWTYIFYLCKIVAGGAANDPVGWQNFPFIPLPPRDHFWFLWALFLGFLIIKGVYALATAFKIQTLSWPLVALASLAFLLLWQSFDLYSPWMQQAFIYLPYILVGISLRLIFFTNPFYILLASLFVFFITLFTSFAGIATLHIFATAVSISAAIVSVLAILSNYITCSWLAVIGQASMAIYLTHTIVSALARSILFAMHINDVTVHIALGVSVGLLVPLIAFMAIDDKRTLKIVGW